MAADLKSMNLYATQPQLADILARNNARMAEFDQIAARRNSAPVQLVPEPVVADVPAPSMREIEVLALVAEGNSNKQIGVRLFLSEETVKSHIRSLLSKLQAQNRAHAVALGYETGLIGFRSLRAAA